MQWSGGRRSANIEDRRGMRVGRPIALGGGASVILALVYLALGGDPSRLLGPTAQNDTGVVDPAQNEAKDFVSVILADTEDTWPQLLRAKGVTYEEPKLVLFTGAVESACGFEESAVGPFYCPRDAKVYLDLDFFNELQSRFGAPGDFARAYVVAHEIGHHVQNELGISERVDSRRRQLDEASANALSVKTELQADCFAGVWAKHAQEQRHILEPGDVEEGLRAAAAIGDDTLQKRARGYVVPESFTHGSSAQRVYWFRQGLEKGSIEACNTFGSAAPPVGRRGR